MKIRSVTFHFLLPLLNCRGWRGTQHVLQIMREQKGEQIKCKEIIFSQGENSAVKCTLNYNVKR